MWKCFDMEDEHSQRNHRHPTPLEGYFTRQAREGAAEFLFLL